MLDKKQHSQDETASFGSKAFPRDRARCLEKLICSAEIHRLLASEHTHKPSPPHVLQYDKDSFGPYLVHCSGARTIKQVASL